MRQKVSVVVFASSLTVLGVVGRAETTAPPPTSRSTSITLRLLPSLPEAAVEPMQWRILAMVRNESAAPFRATPRSHVEGGRIVNIHPSAQNVLPGTSEVFFLRVEATAPAAGTTISLTLNERPDVTVRCRLACGVDLSLLSWEMAWQGKGSTLASVKASPPAGTVFAPTRLPRAWNELGVTWVRTRFFVPNTWRGQTLQVRLGAVDDADITFLNGTPIGQTNGWDVPRSYRLPAEAVRWGHDNELCIAVENSFAGGGIYRSPLQVTIGEVAAGTLAFDEPVRQPECARGPVGQTAPRLPLRRMSVRDGVLYYEDGKEVALWGINTYPQSWTQYNSLKKLGVDPRRSIDEDFDDFEAMGIDIIRIHVFDSEITDGQGHLLQNDHLNVLDYLVAQCNRRGIYLMLTPIAWWGSPNARQDSLSRTTPKEAMSLWPVKWPAQVNYLREFLDHRNPHTGHRLVDEPCLVLFEVINEPTYWTCGDVLTGNPGDTWVNADLSKAAIEGVRQTWRDTVPDAGWQTPTTYAWYRYETVRRYIDTMIAAIRSTGARQPVAYSAFWMQDPDVLQAIADSGCEVITLSAYPGGLATINDDRNLLSEMDNVDSDARLARKVRLVYEFDAPGTIRKVHLYPAMARHWRNRGVQVACQFQYDARAVAHLNCDWPQHYLNLWHTPGKAVSFMIGGEVFRRLPRGAAFPTPPDDQVFLPAAVSYQRNVALLCAADSYMQAGPTDWHPLPSPAAPKRIVSVGTCEYFQYEGTGMVSLTIEGQVATLRIYPDVERLREGWEGKIDAPLTRLHERTHPFRIRMADWKDAIVERREEGRWDLLSAKAADFPARPGSYRLRRTAATGRVSG